MMRIFTSLITYFVMSAALGQSPQTMIFAHNDYEKSIPFFVAYHQQADFIEADVFLYKGKLVVAHTPSEISLDKTLDSLYLKPLQQQIHKNKGNAYPKSNKPLSLMIDLKSEGAPTLTKLVAELKRYPDLIACKSLWITISGDVPDPATWNTFPDFIHFDGRPGIEYTPDQLKRIRLISTSFSNHSSWNGKGVLTAPDRLKIERIVAEAHRKKKPIRFWGAPDFENAWIKLRELDVDIINTDRVVLLANFLQQIPQRSFTSQRKQVAYMPLYEETKWASSPRNIILMIGDGMGLSQLYSGYTANFGSLSIFNIRDIGFSITTASDSYITDSAAGATAMATGKKTNNRFIGVDSLGNPLASILETLKSSGAASAIISNGDVTDATPAAFYAHQSERSLSEAIALDFITSGSSILIGGGKTHFKNRSDGKDLFAELMKSGYAVGTDFDSIDSFTSEKFVLLDDAAVISKLKGRGNFLSASLEKTLSVFKDQPDDFFILLEGAQIDWGGHNNDLGYVVTEVLDFDQAVAAALKFADEDRETLVIVTADHETGGLSILDGDISSGSVYGNFSSNDHSAVMVPVFAYGPGAERFRGVYHNTRIHELIQECLSKSKKQ
ncbi:MAG TPA: alkaline phosphatase [Ohtaekwangia sp.]|nr:alkaline phosphatase [Ohtaekwangia sp.]